MAAFTGVDSQDLGITLDSFRTIFGDFKGRPDYLRLEHCDIETSTLRVETGQMFVPAREKMSAVETRQMSAVDTRQMSSVARTDICLVSTHNVDVSELSIVAISQCSSRR